MKSFIYVEDSITFISDNNSIISCIILKEDKSIIDIEKNMKEVLPDYLIPKINNIHIVSNFPLLYNGKIDYDKLNNLYSFTSYDIPSNLSTIDSIIYLFKNICKNNNVNNNSNFFNCGGDSILLIELINQINKLYMINLNIEDIRNNPTPEMINLLIKHYNKKEKRKLIYYNKSNMVKKLHFNTNKFKITRGEYYNFIIPQIFLKPKCLYTYYMRKCVDCSPIIFSHEISCLECNKNERVIIASHYGKIVLLCLYCGYEYWNYETKERIESSLSLTKDNKNVIIGTYSGNIHIFDIENGKRLCIINTNGEIKSPFGITNDYVYIGNYNHELISISTFDWKIKLIIQLNGSVFSQPLIINDKYLCIITIIGDIIFYEILNNDKILNKLWNINSNQTIFSTPIINNEKNLLCISTVSGLIFIIDYKGNICNKININKNIYSSPILNYIDNSILICSSDGYLLSINWNNSKINYEYYIDKTSISSIPFCIKISKNIIILIINTVNRYSISLLIENGKLPKLLYKIGEFKGDIFSSPVCYKRICCFGTRDDYFYVYKY